MTYKHEPEYRILRSSFVDTLEKQVMHLLQEGWDLHGPTQYQGEVWYQAVTNMRYYWTDRKVEVELQETTPENS